MRYKIKIILFLFLVGGLQQCRPQTEFPKDFKGMLLYVEDLDGIGGTMSGSFSDIVTFSPTLKKHYILTSDNYFDECPTYSPKTNKIYFESKREEYHPAVGLTSPTHLYELDLRTKSIELIDDEEFREAYSFNNKIDLHTPLIDSEGNLLLFQYMWGDYKNSYDKLVSCNLKKNIIESIFDSLYYTFRYVFYEKDASIVFQSNVINSWKEKTNYIAKLDIETKRITKYVQEKNIENNLGDVKFNKIVFVTRDFNHSDVISDLFIYNITNNEKRKIVGIKELGFREIKYPVFKNENFIYFIGSKESTNPDTFDEDIYLLNLNTKEMKQITFTGNIKDNLRYYE
ncbi:MAG: hypothetical protein KDC90_10805 [Ignavibacteriae bacterium]|nr:hypothetical protein [Ignavibacteriota bacterium]